VGEDVTGGGVVVGGGVVGVVGGGDEESDGIGDELIGGGPDRGAEPRRVTVAWPGAKAISAYQEPAGSRERSTVMTTVTDSPGWSVPARAESWSQYAAVEAAQRTGVWPPAVRVTRVLPLPGRALTER
jgi:hypothetical protein